MATVITAPEKVNIEGFKVFLGGAIDMGNSLDWQSHVIKKLKGKPDIVLLNPRRANFKDYELDDQIRWELKHLEVSDVILMWFPEEAIAPISFLETGLYLKSGKLILGADKKFFRRRNLELTCEHYGTSILDSLDDLIAEVLYRSTNTLGQP